MTVTILDYNAGNLRSVARAFEYQGVKTHISSDPAELSKAEILVVPGQGAFSEAMKEINNLGLGPVIKDHIAQGKPYFGICLGLQILFEYSEENGRTEGLGVFPGQVVHFKSTALKIPHMGWNGLEIKQDPIQVFSGLKADPHVYFVHSYYVQTSKTEIVSTTTQYGLDFVSSVQHNNLFACQFHPEKSGEVGQAIIRDFLSGVGVEKD